MHHIRIVKAAHHMHNRIHLTDVRQKLVPQTLAFRRALYKSRDIDKLNHRRSHLCGMIEIRQQVQPLVRHRYDAYIRVNRAERIIC